MARGPGDIRCLGVAVIAGGDSDGPQKVIQDQRALLRAERLWGQAESLGGEPTEDEEVSGSPSTPEQEVDGRDVRHRRRIAGALVLALVSLLIVFIFHARRFELTDIHVSGLHQLTPQEVWLDLDYAPGTYTWQVRPWVVRRRLLRNPLIAKASARLVWPNGVNISVVERVPVALIVTSQLDWEVDGSGLVLRSIPAVTQGGTTLSASSSTVQQEMVSAGASIGLPASLYPFEIPARPHISGVPSALPLIVGLNPSGVTAGATLSAVDVEDAIAVAQGIGASGGAVVAEILVRGSQIYLVTTQGIPVNLGDGGLATTKTGILLGILQDISTEKLLVGSINLASVATPSLQLLPGSPPMQSQGVLTDTSVN